jgi:CRISPR-associated protein Csd1
MSVLQALDRYYDRMAARGEAEPEGFSREKISFVIVLARDGTPAEVRDLRQASGRKLVPQLLEVPAAVKRTVAIMPNLLWDKSAYVLGRTAGEGRRTAEEHARFVAANLAFVQGSEDEGFTAFRRFLEGWAPDRFDAPPFHPDMLDANIVFSFEGETRYLHERDAAKLLLARRGGADGDRAFCLVTGVEGPIARLHPAIKGVDGAQSSGATLVSFNLDAFTSYGKVQGENAPTSRAAAFRYGAALNRMLDRGGDNRLPRPLGDASVVFWADASGAEAEAAGAEWLFGAAAESPTDEEEAVKVRDALEQVAKGRPVELSSGLSVAPGTRFHVLALSPNAARLSVRFWLSDTIEAFARRLSEHYADLRIEPAPWRTPPSINRLLVKTTALQEKFENIPPLLAGEVTRSILTGGRYPRSWLATVIVRLRAGDDPSTGWHAAAIRAVLAREQRLARRNDPHLDPTQEPPMSLNRESRDPAYNLGRLFAALEAAQRSALGKVNATIRDRYMGAASAAPAGVFPLLVRGVQSHLGKLRKDGKGGWIEQEIEEISDRMGEAYPRSLKLEAQGRFFLGYYHQRRAQFSGAKAAGEEEPESGGNTDGE